MADLSTRPFNTIVSDESEPLILVDEADREIGHLDKGACHDGKGVLHRAFSLFIFNDSGELLLQQRSAQKRLWPLFWSNSCCSHPRKGESMETAVERRLAQDGRFRQRVRGVEYDLRVSTVPTMYGESVVMRLLDQSGGILDLKQLGLSKDILKRIYELLKQPNGIILISA